MTKTIYLLRHCESTDNEKGVNGNRNDSSLSVNGINAAKKLVLQLQLHNYDIVFVSPLKRTSQTIKPYLDSLKKQPSIIIDPLTIERDLGILTNTRTGDEKISADQAKNGKSKTAWQPKNGESSVMVYKRATEFYQKLLQRPEKSILICSHQNFLRCLELVIKKEPIDDEHYYFKNPDLLKPGELRVLNINY